MCYDNEKHKFDYKERKVKKRDIILIVIMCIYVAASFLVYIPYFQNDRGKQKSVKVTFDGKEIWSGDLSKNQEVTFQKGGGENVVKILDGKVWMKEADCKGRDCVKQGKIQNKGQSIVCLPHKLVVSIEGDVETDSIVR